MIDFHTCTSLFSNCGSRLLGPCCPTTTPVTKTATSTTIAPTNRSFMCYSLQGSDPWPICNRITKGSDPQEFGRVAAGNPFTLRRRHRQPAHRIKHLWNAADLVRVIAAREDVLGTRELDGQLDAVGIEVHGVVIERLQVGAGRAADVGAALGKCLVAAIEPFGE